MPERASDSLPSKESAQGQKLTGDNNFPEDRVPGFHGFDREQPGADVADNGAGVGKVGTDDGNNGACVGNHGADVGKKKASDDDTEEGAGPNQDHGEHKASGGSHYLGAEVNVQSQAINAADSPCMQQKTTLEKLMRAYRLTPDTVSQDASKNIPPKPYEGFQLKCWNLCTNQRFNWLIAFLLLIGIAQTGLEKDFPFWWMDSINILFNFIFALELGVRLYGSPVLPRYHDNALIVDSIVVFGSFIDLGAQMFVKGGVPRGELLKLLRIVRLFKVLKVLMTDTMRALAVTFLRAFVTICMAMIPTTLLIYCFGMLMRVMMARDFDNADLQNTAKKYFHSLPVSMLTLCEVMFGNFAFSEVITFPLVKSGVSPLASFMWISFEICVQILLLNFSTAMVVEVSVRMGRADDELIARENMVKHVLNIAHLRKNFVRLDKDHDGFLTLEDLQQGLENDLELVKLLGIESKDVKYLFEVIAGSKDAKRISVEDLFSAVVTTRGSSQSVEMMSLVLQTKRLERGIREISENAASIGKRLTILQQEQDIVAAETHDYHWGQSLLDMRRLQEEFHRLSEFIMSVDGKKEPQPMSVASLKESYAAYAAIQRLQETMEQVRHAASNESTDVRHTDSADNFMQNVSQEYIDKFRNVAEEEVQRTHTELVQMHRHAQKLQSNNGSNNSGMDAAHLPVDTSLARQLDA